MPKNSTFAARLREVLDSTGMTQSELSRKSGVSKSSLTHYIKGDWEGKQDAVYAIARAAGVSEAWLMGYDVDETKRSGADNILPLPGTYRVPLIGSIACGQPVLAVEEAEEAVEVPDLVHADFALRCKGDSMINARIFDGDIVYVRRQPEVENGQIAAVRIGDEATLKRVYYLQESDQLTLRACNPLYPDMHYSGAQLDEVEVLGLAVGFYSAVRHD